MKVGVILPLGAQGKKHIVPPYSEIRELALATETEGLDSAWVYDHLIYRFDEQLTTGVQEAWTVLTGLAEVTDRVELGCLVFCVPFRNPALLAKMAVTLDDVADGRLILGLGAGWHKPEFDAFGYTFDHLASRFDEALQIIVPLVKTGTVDFTGHYYAAPNCELIPKPREGGIPVLIASHKPRMLQLTARYADQWNTAWLGHVEALAERRDPLVAACTELGRDPNTLEITVGVNVKFPELGIELEEIDPAKTIAGSVDDVAAAIRAYAGAGVGHLVCALEPLTTESVALLARAAEQAKQA
jgi:alkanesulfonate monooxygenase SsuD/methylene tetrahydromethanopterin reductase-like flavin-dependent oxidoreductase (luciferase family)